MTLAIFMTVICKMAFQPELNPILNGLLKLFARDALIHLSASNPLRNLLNTIEHDGKDKAGGHLALHCMRIAVDQLIRLLGPSDWKTLYLTERFCDCLWHTGQSEERARMRQQLLQAQKSRYSSHARNVLWTMINVAEDHLLVDADLNRAELTFAEVLKLADSDGSRA